jgi:hypothetical protein
MVSALCRSAVGFAAHRAGVPLNRAEAERLFAALSDGSLVADEFGMPRLVVSQNAAG